MREERIKELETLFRTFEYGLPISASTAMKYKGVGPKTLAILVARQIVKMDPEEEQVVRFTAKRVPAMVKFMVEFEGRATTVEFYPPRAHMDGSREVVIGGIAQVFVLARGKKPTRYEAIACVRKHLAKRGISAINGKRIEAQ